MRGYRENQFRLDTVWSTKHSAWTDGCLQCVLL